MSDSIDSPLPPTATSNAPSAPPRKRRWLVVLCALALIPLLYFGFLIAFFETPLGPTLVNRRPEKFQMHWQSGSMWRPGQIHLEGLELRGHTQKGSWSVVLDQADLTVDLPTLRNRELRVTEALATSCRVSWKSKGSDRAEETKPHDIAPTSGPAPSSTAGPESGGSRSKKPKWRFTFDDIDIQDLHEVWLDSNRLVADGRESGSLGPGKARLALSIQPRGPISIPKFEMSLGTGHVELGGEDQGAFDDFYVRGELAPFVPRQHRGIDWLRFLSVEVRVAAEAWGIDSGLDATSLLLRDLPVAVGGQGRLATLIRLDEGKLLPGSKLELAGEEIQLDYLSYRGSGAGRLKMVIEEDAQLELRLEEFTISDSGRQAHYIEGSGLKLEASSPSLDLLNPKPEARAVVTLPPSRIPDFSFYDEYLPANSPVRLIAGQGEAEARFGFEIAEGQAPKLAGQIRISGRAVEATYEEQRLTGEVDVRAQVSGVLGTDLKHQLFSLRNTSLILDEVKVVGSDSTNPWWARIEIPSGSMSLGRPLGVSADISAVVADSRPLIALALKKRSIPKWVERVLSLHPLSVTSRLEVNHEHIFLRDLLLRGGTHLNAKAELQLADRANMGLVLLQWRRLALAAELGPGEGERKIDLIGAKKFFAQQEPIWEQRFAQ